MNSSTLAYVSHPLLLRLPALRRRHQAVEPGHGLAELWIPLSPLSVLGESLEVEAEVSIVSGG